MFDYVLNNTKPLVFPDNAGLNDGLVYDPESGKLYDPNNADPIGEYEYKWSQGRWSSHLDIYSLERTDRVYVNIAGDVMTGGLKMGVDIKNPLAKEKFYVSRYDLDTLPPIQNTIVLFKNHQMQGVQSINNRLSLKNNAEVLGGHKLSYTLEWYKLKLDPHIDESTGLVNIPTETDWGAVKIPFNLGSSYFLTENDSYHWIRTKQVVTETSSDNISSSVTSVVDTNMIITSNPNPSTP